MSQYYPNHSSFTEVYWHKKLPLVQTSEFDFWRCVEFEDAFYGKTVSKLFQGNLRPVSLNNRYSDLFPNQKLSYWSSNKDITKKEIIKHGSSKNILTFWAYDDASSTFPILSEKRSQLIIIDGIQLEFEKILRKVDENIKLDDNETKLIQQILDEQPDCVAYKSHVRNEGVNFLFFEKGFNKLALREVGLRLGEFPGKNKRTIHCAQTSDYWAILESYGKYFMPIAKVKMDASYLNSDEYLNRKKIVKIAHDVYHHAMSQNLKNKF